MTLRAAEFGTYADMKKKNEIDRILARREGEAPGDAMMIGYVGDGGKGKGKRQRKGQR